MEYHRFSSRLEKDDLVEHFTFFPEERYLISQGRKDANVLDFAVLLKSFRFLGYPPRNKEDIPNQVVSWISGQLGVDQVFFTEYRWKDSVWKAHLASIRTFTGFRPFNAVDSEELVRWLVDKGGNHPTRSGMFSAGIKRCRGLRIELPTGKEFGRLMVSAWQQYLNETCRKISERLSPEERRWTGASIPARERKPAMNG